MDVKGKMIAGVKAYLFRVVEDDNTRAVRSKQM
jgi:hypothetical protein